MNVASRPKYISRMCNIHSNCALSFQFPISQFLHYEIWSQNTENLKIILLFREWCILLSINSTDTKYFIVWVNRTLWIIVYSNMRDFPEYVLILYQNVVEIF